MNASRTFAYKAWVLSDATLIVTNGHEYTYTDEATDATEGGYAVFTRVSGRERQARYPTVTARISEARSRKLRRFTAMSRSEAKPGEIRNVIRIERGSFTTFVKVSAGRGRIRPHFSGKSA